jgi:hypothetical protein
MIGESVNTNHCKASMKRLEQKLRREVKPYFMLDLQNSQYAANLIFLCSKRKCTTYLFSVQIIESKLLNVDKNYQLSFIWFFL